MSWEECQICKKDSRHGGNCNGTGSNKPCLGFDRDERGYIEEENDGEIDVGVGMSFPKMYDWTNKYEWNGSPVYFTDIHPIGWNMKTLELICECCFRYFDGMAGDSDEEQRTVKKHSKCVKLDDFRKGKKK